MPNMELCVCVCNSNKGNKNNIMIGEPTRVLEVEQVVWAHNFQEGPSWKRGVVCYQLGPESYIVGKGSCG